MRVAAVQFCPVLKDRETNLRTAAGLVMQAAQGGAELVVLPELCTTGYSFMSYEDALPFAEQISDFGRVGGARSMEVFGALAKKFNLHIVWGVMEKGYGTGRLYNSQVLMCPSQRFLSYRKVNRWANDFLWASEGEAMPPIEVIQGKRVGMVICRDIRDKDIDDQKEFFEKGETDVVCMSANWGDGGFPSTSWMDFVVDNNTTLVISNRYGRETNNNFGEGGICVILPDQRVICEGLAWEQDCIVYADV